MSHPTQINRRVIGLVILKVIQVNTDSSSSVGKIDLFEYDVFEC